MNNKYDDIADLLIRKQTADISIYEDSFLDKAFQKKMAELNCQTVDEYADILEKNFSARADFLNSLNISYSEFFRNPLTYSVLERIILPAMSLKKGEPGRKEIRIWTAACAAGQETYSLAMLLEELQNEAGDKIYFRIFATDIDETQLNKAREGQYTPTGLNNVNLKRLNRWFNPDGDRYSVKQELKKNIDFSVFDLFNEQFVCPPGSIFGNFDLIFCANLLFYFKPKYQMKIVERATKSLANGGFLITGETEREILIRQNFREVYPYSAIFQKKIPI